MEEKLKDFASKAGKGGMPGAPKGLGLGVKLLAAGAAAVYGVQQSMYTGHFINLMAMNLSFIILSESTCKISYTYNQIPFLVEGGHRAIIFGRIGGIKPHIMAEGLHFRLPWFEYPIVYDIRAKPRTMSSPTGSKDLEMVSQNTKIK